jgi:hypothetical protein
MEPGMFSRLRRAAVIFVLIGVAGAIIGLLARTTGASTAVVYALAGAVFGLLVALGSKVVLGEQRVPVVEPRKATFGAEDGEDEVSAMWFAIAVHSRESYRASPGPAVVGAHGTAAGRSSLSKSPKQPLPADFG